MAFLGFLLLCVFLPYGASNARVILPRFHQKAAPVVWSVTVDHSGHGNFTTVQAAINWVPSNSNQWVRIHVKAGIYKEKVNIAKEKTFIFLEGEGQGQTSIEWGQHGTPPDKYSTVTVFADNFLASHITFKNTHDLGIEYPHAFDKAPAIVIYGDKAAFFDCGFMSLQDTLGDWKGWHLFQSCYIEGGVDFIWGAGQSQYVDCKITSKAGNLGPGRIYGYITAQGRASPSDTSAFVFKGGSVDGTGKTELGRAYKQYSTVIFSETYLGSNVMPEGWSSWSFTGHESTITYDEYGCKGPGADTSKRVKWMKQLSAAELDKYLDPAKFIDQDGWIGRLPIHN